MLEVTEDFFSIAKWEVEAINKLNGEISRKEKMRIELDFLKSISLKF